MWNKETFGHNNLSVNKSVNKDEKTATIKLVAVFLCKNYVNQFISM